MSRDSYKGQYNNVKIYGDYFLFSNLVLYHNLSVPTKPTMVIIIICFKNIRGSVVLDVMARFITIVLLATFVAGNIDDCFTHFHTKILLSTCS